MESGCVDNVLQVGESRAAAGPSVHPSVPRGRGARPLPSEQPLRPAGARTLPGALTGPDGPPERRAPVSSRPSPPPVSPDGPVRVGNESAGRAPRWGRGVGVGRPPPGEQVLEGCEPCWGADVDKGAAGRPRRRVCDGAVRGGGGGAGRADNAGRASRWPGRSPSALPSPVARPLSFSSSPPAPTSGGEGGHVHAARRPLLTGLRRAAAATRRSRCGVRSGPASSVATGDLNVFSLRLSAASEQRRRWGAGGAGGAGRRAGPLS